VCQFTYLINVKCQIIHLDRVVYSGAMEVNQFNIHLQSVDLGNIVNNTMNTINIQYQAWISDFDLLTLLYILLICITVFVFFPVFVHRMKHPFWSKMYVASSCRIINATQHKGVLTKNPLSEKSKYYDPVNTQFHCLSSDGDNEKDQFILSYIHQMVKDEYIRKKDVVYAPTQEDIYALVKNVRFPVYCTMYREPILRLDLNNMSANSDNIDKKDNAMQYTEKGVIMHRPLDVYLPNKRHYIVYYVDFLCVHHLYRKKRIGPTLIYTACAEIRKDIYKRYRIDESKQEELHITTDKDIWLSDRCIGDIYMSKHETYSLPIVPLVVYKTHIWDIQNIECGVTNTTIHPMQCICLTSKPEHKKWLLQVFEQAREWKKTVVLTSLENAIAQIERGILIIYILVYNNNIHHTYIFKDAHTKYRNVNAIECISSLYRPDLGKDLQLFVDLFHYILFDLKNGNREKKYGYVNIDDISDNCFLSTSENRFVKRMGSISQYYYFFNYKETTCHKRDFFTLY
jgi:hypothetical protein